MDMDSDTIVVVAHEQALPKGLAVGAKRSHYVSRACHECRKRKVKCSGHQPGPCQKCFLAQKECVYSTGRKRRRRGSTGETQRRSMETSQTIRSTQDNSSTPQDTVVHGTRAAHGEVTPSSSSSDSVVVAQMDMLSRIRRLEEALVAERNQRAKDEQMQLPISDEWDLGVVEAADQGHIEVQVLDVETHNSEAPAGMDIHEVQAKASDSFTKPSQSPQHQDLVLELWPSEPTAADIEQVKLALQRFFRHVHIYYACLNEVQVFSQLDEYASMQGINTPSEQTMEFIALIKAILALMAVYEQPSTPLSPIPGWEYYCQSSDLLRRTTMFGQGSLLTIQCFIIRAAFLLISGEHNSAYEAAGQAVRLCFQIRLHNQTSWQDLSPFDVHMRQRVLWSVYAIDKSISQLCGVPYLMRDSDINVDMPAAFDDQLLGLSEEVPAETPLSSVCSYLKWAVQYARLVSVTWDKIFSQNAPRPVDGELIATLDARIVYLRDSLPHFLDFKSDFITNPDPSFPDFVMEEALSLRLLTNNLRLVLRREDVAPPEMHDDQRRAGIAIAQETLDIVSTFFHSTRYLPVHNYSTVSFSTGAIISLSTALLSDRAPMDVRRDATTSVEKALGILQALSPVFAPARGNLQKLSRLNGLKGKLDTFPAHQQALEAIDVDQMPGFLSQERSSEPVQSLLQGFDDASLTGPSNGDNFIRAMFTPSFDVTSWGIYLDGT